MRAGHPEDATDGLGSITDGAGVVWYWNTAQSEWQQAHTIVSGDTLWKLTRTYYGAYSLPAVATIHEVPQNLAIQGPDPNMGLIPGDVILIPRLAQPAAPPAPVNVVPATVPQDPPPTVVTTVQAPAGSGTPGPNDLPAGWPAGVPYPPTGTVPTNPPAPVTVLPEVVVTGDAPAGDVVLAGTTAATVAKPAAPFWTGGRIAIGLALAGAGVGTIIYLATRKPKRRNPSHYRRRV